MSYRKKTCLDCLCHKLKSFSHHNVVNLWYFRIPGLKYLRSTTLGCNDLILENRSLIKSTRRSYCWKVYIFCSQTEHHVTYHLKWEMTIPNHKLTIFELELSLFSHLRYTGTRLIFWSAPTIMPTIIAMFWSVCPFVSSERQSWKDWAQYFWGNWHDPSECLWKFTNFYDFCKSFKNPHNNIIKSVNFFVIVL